MVGAEPAQLTLAAVDLLVERVDQGEAGGERRRPRLGQREPVEQAPAAGAEQIAVPVGDAVLEQDRVDTVLQRASVLDQVQPETGPLPLRSDRRIGQPDLGYQVTASELGQHPAVDLVGLTGQRRDPARLDRVGDPHVPAAKLELVVHEAGAAHRLDHRQHRLIAQSRDQPRQPVTVGRDRADPGTITVTLERLPIKTLAAEIQSNVEHRWGLPSSLEDAWSFPPREALLHQIPYHALQLATGRHAWQRFSHVSAVLEAVGFATGCHIKAPSFVVW